MSETSVGKVIKNNSGKQQDSKTSKENKQKTEELVKELVKDCETPKRGPGRPVGSGKKTPPSTSPSRPKTPPIGLNEMNSDTRTGPRLSPADEIRNKIIIERMRLYIKKFPEYNRFFEGFNPYNHTPKENQEIMDSFLDLIHSEIEFHTAPAAISTFFESAEDAATVWAMENPENVASEVISDLCGVSGAILKDPAVSLDIRLLECEINGYLPKNPKLRLILNISRVIFSYYGKSKLAGKTKNQKQPDVGDDTDKKYKNF